MSQDILYSKTLGWSHKFTHKPVNLLADNGPNAPIKRTIPKGSLIRVYQGALVEPPLDPIISPTAAHYVIEVAPPPNGFWVAYPSELNLLADVHTDPAYKADLTARQMRLGWAKFTDLQPNSLIDIKKGGLTDDKINEAEPSKPIPPEKVIIDPEVIDQPEGGDGKILGVPWWVLLLGLGVVYHATKKRGA